MWSKNWLRNYIIENWSNYVKILDRIGTTKFIAGFDLGGLIQFVRPNRLSLPLAQNDLRETLGFKKTDRIIDELNPEVKNPYKLSPVTTRLDVVVLWINNFVIG